MSWLQEVFSAVLEMSGAAALAAAGVILIRVPLSRLPKRFSYALWFVVLFRMLCPVSFSSAFSFLGLLQRAGETGRMAAAVDRAAGGAVPAGAGMPAAGKNAALAGGAVLPAGGAETAGWTMLGVLSVVWLAGVLLFLLYGAAAYLRVRRTLSTAVRVREGIYETDRIGTALICGFFPPRIYLPTELGAAKAEYILAHEWTHLKRGDHWVKLIAFTAMALHWFNPLAWLTFVLMGRDMELSCDERVLSRADQDVRGEYAQALLALSARGRGILTAPGPLAFGEGSTAARIKNVLRYRKPVFWAAAAAVLAVAVAAVVLLSNPGERFDPDRVRKDAMLFSTEETGLLKIGEAGAAHYYAAFTGENIPEEYRITEYRITKIVLTAGDKTEFCVGVTADYSTTGRYFLSANGSFVPNGAGGDCTGDYKEFRIKSLDGGEYEIVSMGTGGGAQGLSPAAPAYEPSEEIRALVEENVKAITSSPALSSAPRDYINAHPEAYEAILKYGGEDALQYMLLQFEQGNAAGLRGHILMYLCKDILGARNNVEDETLSPEEWYAALDIQEEIRLPDYRYDGDDPALAAVWQAVTEQYSGDEGFTVAAPYLYGSYEEDGLLKAFVTAYFQTYRLFGGRLEETSGGLVPAAITFRKGSGGYTLVSYEAAMDGSLFPPSIREFCVMPASEKEIPGLADRMLAGYGKEEGMRELQTELLRKHLEANHVEKALITAPDGKMQFSFPASQSD